MSDIPDIPMGSPGPVSIGQHTLRKSAADRLATFEVLAHQVVRYATEHATAQNVVSVLEDDRAEIKQAAVGRLMLTLDPNGKEGKFHSQTSAEKVVETDELYHDHREKQRGAVWELAAQDARLFVAKARLTFYAGA